MTTKQELKNYCRKYNIKGFSTLNKPELEKLVKKHIRKLENTPLGKYKKFLKVFDKHVLDPKEGKIEAGKLREIVTENIVDYGGQVPFYLDELEEKNLIHIYKKTRGYPRLTKPLPHEPYRLYYIKVKRKNLSWYFDKEGQYLK